MTIKTDLSLGVVQLLDENMLLLHNQINLKTDNAYSNMYGDIELIKKLENKYRKKKFLHADEQFLITSGASLALSTAFISFKQCKFLIPNPGYPQYLNLCKSLNIEYSFYKIDQDSKATTEAIIEGIDNGAEVIIINSPHNPTGMKFTENEINEIVKCSKNHEATIIADEVYNYFSKNSEISFKKYSYEKIIYINSFSKEYGLPSYRIGYVISSNSIIKKMAKIHWNLSLQGSNILQKTASKLIEVVEIKKEDMKNKIDFNRKQLINICNEFSISYLKEKNGIFFVMKVPDIFENDIVFKLFLEKKFKTKIQLLDEFGESLVGFYRINLSVSYEEIHNFCENISLLYRRT